MAAIPINPPSNTQGNSTYRSEREKELEEKLNEWISDETATGQKETASLKILDAFRQGSLCKGAVLKLDNLGLSSLPEAIKLLKHQALLTLEVIMII